MLLALDTATTTASLAVYDEETGRLLAEQTWEARRRQTQELLAAAAALLAQVNLTPAMINALAVTTGPGSFTGVRIGISTVKGMALGLNDPPQVIGIPTLSVTAAPWLDAAQTNSTQVCAVLQAGRGRYNWVFFECGEHLRRPTADEHVIGRVDALGAALIEAATPIWLVGELTEEIIEQSAGIEHIQVIDNVSGQRRASQLARVAALHLAAGRVDDLRELQPLYLNTP